MLVVERISDRQTQSKEAVGICCIENFGGYGGEKRAVRRLPGDLGLTAFGVLSAGPSDEQTAFVSHSAEQADRFRCESKTLTGENPRWFESRIPVGLAPA